MTISSDLNRISYAGNGTTVLFPVNYYFLQDSHLQVILVAANGTETVQTLTTNYTVTGAGNEAGGSITMLVAPPTGTQLIVVRNVPATQETDYLANDPFPAESHERALDKLTMLVQQNKLESDRALKVPLASLPTTSTELPIPVGNKLLAWNSNASAIVNFDPGSIISIVGQQNSFADTFTGNGSTVNFTLTRQPGSVFNLDVSVNGVTQVPNVDYILAGSTLTFTTAPPAVASQILARYSEVYAESIGDAQNVRYLPAGTGAQQTTVQAKLRESVSVKDFGAVGDGVTDDTAAIQAAVDYGIANNKQVVIPTGQYNVDTVTVLNPAYNFGIHSFDARILGTATTPTAGVFQFINCVDFNVTGSIHFLTANNTNYASGLYVSTAVGGNQATTRVNIYNPSFRNFKIALWFGDIDVDRQCSEINVFGANTFTCPIALYLAGSQTLASFNGCNLVSEPNTALLATADEKCIWVEGGVATVVGGKIVKAVTPTQYAIQLNVSDGPTFGNTYGAIRVSGCHIETACALAVVSNPRAFVSTTSLTSNLTIVAAGGYVGPSSINDDFITVTDAGYEGIIQVENCNFYSSALQRVGFNISSVAPNVKIQTDRKSFNEGFLNWVGGVSGGNMYHDLIPAVLATGINDTIPATETVLKFLNNITTLEYGRYGAQYDTSTGLFTVTQTLGFAMMQLIASIDGGGGTGVLTVKLNGSIIVTAPYSTTGTIVANLPRLLVGDTIGVYFTPAAPVGLDSSVKQRLSIQCSV
jgi:hypothetical protein